VGGRTWETICEDYDIQWLDIGIVWRAHGGIEYIQTIIERSLERSSCGSATYITHNMSDFKTRCV
jgi:hypothetical protein